jgi:hypothetical protein
MRLKVTGVRWRDKPPDAQAALAWMEEGLRRFADTLAEVVGTAIFERISQGRWHTSRNRNYAPYRARIEYLYGSSRARRGRGAGRLRNAQHPLNDALSVPLEGGLNQGDALDRLRFNFLVRALHRDARSVAGGGAAMGPRRTRKTLREIGVYDVSGALDEIDRVRQLYARRPAGENGEREARQAYQRAIQALLYGESDLGRFLRESRMGQRYWKHAENAAQKHARNARVLYGAQSFESEGRDAGMTLRNARAKALLAAHKRSRNERSTTVGGRRTGGFTWGFQTGTLAEAWAAAEPTLELLKGRFTVTLAPDNARQGRTPGALTLTSYLKRQIRREGGNPNLLGTQDARQRVRAALEQVQGEWARRGIRLR